MAHFQILKLTTMNGIIFDIKRYSVNDGPGVRTTLFLKGCPLNCWWCHNPESQKPEIETCIIENKLDGIVYEQEKIVGKQLSVNEIIREVEKETIFHEESNGGVTFSGGEPLMQMEFLESLLDECKLRNIHSAVDTSGFIHRSHFEAIAEKADLFLFDLKLIDNELHRKYCGVSNQCIIENLKYLSSKKKHTIIRFPVTPTINDSEENIRDMKNLLISIKNENLNEINLLTYHKNGSNKYKRFNLENKMLNTPELKKEDLVNLKTEFESIGFKAVIS